MLKNIIAIFLFLYLLKYFILPTFEKFTPQEMKNYKKMLKDNCDKATEIRNKVKKMNPDPNLVVSKCLDNQLPKNIFPDCPGLIHTSITIFNKNIDFGTVLHT